MTRLLTLLAPVLVFGLVVFVHELGHFLAAKITGVYAPVFSLGWGTRLLGFRYGETDYRISWFPIGGFVNMATAADETMSFATPPVDGAVADAVRIAAPPADAVRTDAGVLDVPAEATGDTPDHTGPRRGLNPVRWDPTAAHPFGPRPVPANRWFESKPLAARLFILLAGVAMNVLLAFTINAGSVAVRGRAYLPAVVDSVIAGRPAARAGLAAGDSVIAVDGRPVRTWAEVLEGVVPVTSGSVRLRVVRGGVPRDLVVSPQAERAPDPITGAPRTIGRIGVLPRLVPAHERLGFGASLAEGARETWRTAESVVTVVRGLFAGDVAVSNLGGPIAIARSSVQAARLGLEPLFGLIALLSVNIAVLNLLPIPVLDGGQVLVNVLEAAKGGAFSARTREYILRTGLAAVALLFVTVMWNDLSRWAGDLLHR